MLVLTLVFLVTRLGLSSMREEFCFDINALEVIVLVSPRFCRRSGASKEGL